MKKLPKKIYVWWEQDGKEHYLMVSDEFSFIDCDNVGIYELIEEGSTKQEIIWIPRKK